MSQVDKPRPFNVNQNVLLKGTCDFEQVFNGLEIYKYIYVLLKEKNLFNIYMIFILFYL